MPKARAFATKRREKENVKNLLPTVKEHAGYVQKVRVNTERTVD